MQSLENPLTCWLDRYTSGITVQGSKFLLTDYWLGEVPNTFKVLLDPVTIPGLVFYVTRNLRAWGAVELLLLLSVDLKPTNYRK